MSAGEVGVAGADGAGAAEGLVAGVAGPFVGLGARVHPLTARSIEPTRPMNTIRTSITALLAPTLVSIAASANLFDPPHAVLAAPGDCARSGDPRPTSYKR